MFSNLILLNRQKKLSASIVCLMLFLHFHQCYSQTLQDFTCSFANPDGASVIACGSVVTATVHYPASITQITLTAPNTFMINDVNGGAVGLLQPINGNLVRHVFNVTGAGPMVVQFGYRNCVVYGDGTLSTTDLIFDCDGGTVANPVQFTAQIIAPSNAQAGLTVELNGQYAKAVHSQVPAIALSPSTVVQSAAPNDEVTRTFTVTFRSLSIQNFELMVNMENDVEFNPNEPLRITAPGIDDIVLDDFILGNTFNSISLNDYSSHVVSNGNTRTLTFKQNIKLLCAAIITPPLIPQSTVNARVACLCGNSQFFNATPIQLNGIAGSVPTINNANTNLIPINSETVPCSGLYEYWVQFSVSGTTARLDQIQIPINTSSFQVQSVEIGTGNNFITAQHTVSNNQITIPSNSFDANNPWPGFISSFSGNPGAWFQMPNSGSLQIIIKITLMYECNSVEACQSAPTQLSPTSGNILMLNLTNTCLSSYGATINLPNIASPSTIASTVSGGCIPFNIDVGSISNAPFSYFINLPNSSPFQLNQGNTTLFDCNEVSYRALLSITSPANATLGNITGLNINGQNAVAQNIGGNLIFDLPPGTNPNQPGNSYTIQFTLNGIACPDPNATFGSIEYNLAVQAVCNDCIGNPCIKNLDCNTDILFVHCPGPCDSRVGIDADLTIHRATFGWANPTAYPENPLTNLNFIADPIERENQLRRLYPFDLFAIAATGSVQPTGNFNDLHQYLSFEMAYSNSALGANFFNLVSFHVTFHNSATNQSITINNQNIPFEFVTATENDIPGLNNPMWVRELRWQANDLANLGININTAAWQIEDFEATFRVTAAQPIGFFEVDFLCQFRSESQVVNNQGDVQSSTTHISCDPYGSSLLILIPDVELVQQSAQTGPLLLPGDTQNQPSAVITPNQTCRFGHAIGIRHRGGLGDQVDDFPFEFRPLTAWPNQLVSNQVLAVNDLYNGPFSYSAATPFTYTGNANNLLPPLEKGEITEPYQGLVLSMSRTCPINSPSQIPITLPINRGAYLHSGHNMNANNTLPLLNPSAINMPVGMACGNMTNLAVSSSPIPLSNFQPQYAFRLSAPETAQGLPVVFRFNLGPNAPIGVSLGNLIYNGLSLTPNNAGWYVFDGGWPNVTQNNASIPITLGNDGCVSQSFNINFEWRIFCTQAQKDDFLADNTQTDNCGACSVTRSFQRNAATITAATVTNNFSREGCELVWTLDIINQANQSTIDLSQLNLNFATGLIYQSANLGIVNCENTNPTLTPPNFTLIAESVPVTATYIQTTLSTANLELQAACTLRYTLRFQLGEDLCNTYENNSSLIQAHLSGKNVCNTEFNIQPLAINHSQVYNLIQQLKNQTPSCCVPLPLLDIQHSCGSSPGQVSFENSLGFPVQVSLLEQGSTLNTQNVPIGGTYNSGPLPPGNYGLVTQNMANGAFFSQTFTLNALPLPTVNITSTGFLCQGGTPTLLTALSPTEVTYSWNGGIASNESTFETFQSNNSVTVTDLNGCQNTSNHFLSTIMVLQPYQIIMDGTTQLCPNQSITLSATPYYAANTYSWVDASGIILGTGPQIQLNQSTSVQLQVSAGPNAGCSFLAANGPVNIESDLGFCDCVCKDGVTLPYELDNINSHEDILNFFNIQTSMVSNRCFKVNSSFDITSEFWLNNCELIMAPGTSIHVYGQGVFRAGGNTEIKGCDKMWAGIYNYGKVIFRGVTISDAQYAIVAGRSFQFSPATNLRFTTFKNNYIGLTNSTEAGFHNVRMSYCLFDGGPLKENYIGQTPPALHQGGLAGIRIHHNFSLNLNNTISFNNLFNGIITNNAILNVRGSKFSSSWYEDDQPLYHYAYSNDIKVAWQYPMVYGTFGAGINAFNNSIVSVSGPDPDLNPNYVMFHGYKNAISAEISTLRVYNCRFTGSNNFPLETGIRIFGAQPHQSFDIFNNRIRAVKRGVEIMYNNSKQSIVNSNSIFIQDQYLGSDNIIVNHAIKDGIFMAYNYTQKAPSISNNFVTTITANRANGIFAQYVQGLEIHGNQVTRLGNAPGYSFGTEYCKGYLDNNQSLKAWPQINPPADDYSYNFTHSNLDIFGNCSQNTKFGFNFEDNCVNTKFVRNRIGLHQPFHPVDRGGALRIGVNGVIADQVDRMNFFETHPNNPQAIIAVKEMDNDNPFNENNFVYGRFSVQTNTLSPYDEQNYYPVHQPSDQNCMQDEFFRCIPISTGNSNTTQCQFTMPPTIGTPGNEDELHKVLSALAKDSIHFSQFEEVSLHHLERTFEQLLRKQEVIMPDTGIALSYKQALAQSNTSKFNRAEEAIGRLDIVGAQAAYLLDLHSTTQGLMDILAEKDSLLALNEEEPDSLLLDELSQVQWQLQEKQVEWEIFNNQWQAQRASKADSMAYWNAAVSPQRAFETAERDLNNLIERTVARGIYYFDASEKQLIESLAYQCPLVGGPAVYKARALFYSYATDFFDNYALCNMAGIQFRRPAPESQAEAQTPKFSVFPNPNNGSFTIKWNGEAGPISIRVHDLSGRLVHSSSMSSNDSLLSLPSDLLSNGIYLLELYHIHTQHIQHEKLLISK